MVAPNARLQRTRLRTPLSRKLLGGSVSVLSGPSVSRSNVGWPGYVNIAGG